MATPKDSQALGNDARIIVLCKRCDVAPATQQARQDAVCEDCFIQYITTKAVKRMESYRARGKNLKPAQQLLLPLSFGPSSTSLLYLLDQQLKGQFERMKRTSYELHIVHVDLHTNHSHETLGRMDRLKEIFPNHTYSTLGIEESLRLPSIEWASLKLPHSSEQSATTTRFQALLDSLPSPTSKSDMIYTLLTRLLVSYAQAHNCTSILFGDSTTRLAERALISTAAGRGFSLPWLVSDGPSPLPSLQTSHSTPFPQPLNFHYPLRDILRKELVILTRLLTTANSSLSHVIIYDPSKHVSASNKTTTIDDLMVQYFESVEENYPSIVANVVRTSSKLVAGGQNTNSEQRCGMCGFPTEEGAGGLSGWGGDQNDGSGVERRGDGRGLLCYGCSRSIDG